MDLINEYNNKHFRAYAQALNILQITNMTKGQFEELFKYLSDDKYYYAAEFMETVKKLNENFTQGSHFKKNGGTRFGRKRKQNSRSGNRT